MVLRIPKICVSAYFVIIPILYFNSCTLEFIKHSSIVLPIVLMCILSWFAFLTMERATVSLSYILPIVCYILILTVLFLIGAQNRVSILMDDLKNMIYFLFFVLVFAVYSDAQHKNEREMIVSIWFVDTVFSCVYSIYRLIDDPTLSRLLSTGSYHTTDEAVRARGVISYGVVYGLTLILVTLFFLVIQKKEKRLLKIFVMVLFGLALMLAQFTIAILLAVLGIVCVFLEVKSNTSDKQKKWQVRLISLFLIGTIGIFVFFLLIELIGESDFVGYEIKSRLQEISLLLKGQELKGTDLLARFLQYSKSLVAFFSSCGMGKIVFDSVSVGSHSQWIDGFGNYGLLFILFIFAIFVFRKFAIQRLPNENSKKLYKMVFGVYIIMSLTNTSMWAPIALDLCVIIPFLCMDKVVE